MFTNQNTPGSRNDGLTLDQSSKPQQKMEEIHSTIGSIKSSQMENTSLDSDTPPSLQTVKSVECSTQKEGSGTRGDWTAGTAPKGPWKAFSLQEKEYLQAEPKPESSIKGQETLLLKNALQPQQVYVFYSNEYIYGYIYLSVIASIHLLFIHYYIIAALKAGKIVYPAERRNPKTAQTSTKETSPQRRASRGNREEDMEVSSPARHSPSRWSPASYSLQSPEHKCELNTLSSFLTSPQIYLHYNYQINLNNTFFFWQPEVGRIVETQGVTSTQVVPTQAKVAIISAQYAPLPAVFHDKVKTKGNIVEQKLVPGTPEVNITCSWNPFYLK